MTNIGLTCLTKCTKTFKKTFVKVIKNAKAGGAGNAGRKCTDGTDRAADRGRRTLEKAGRTTIRTTA